MTKEEWDNALDFASSIESGHSPEEATAIAAAILFNQGMVEAQFGIDNGQPGAIETGVCLLKTSEDILNLYQPKDVKRFSLDHPDE